MIWHPDWAGVLSGQPLAWIGTGFVTTLLVTLVGSLLATVMMLLLLALRMMPGRSGRLLVAGWVSLFRNTPLLVQLFFGILPPGARCRSDGATIWPTTTAGRHCPVMFLG
ncbi:hypothetical protein SODG_000301 [Sodalis praecaptivus]